ncbi:hypothetical protein DM01DRAFT_162482 [Hesseltinella vesiculosa]|uniref:Uncharacterized protein n=1 Tax=Hesseltinella vesiculosa TaxID=101127 RepID=A0A1X2GI29_9FUNG|nr:hypothetical protein DM01DRAFT_162482 [Hesseltinella vesiculosa]
MVNPSFRRQSWQIFGKHIFIFFCPVCWNHLDVSGILDQQPCNLFLVFDGFGDLLSTAHVVKLLVLAMGFVFFAIGSYHYSTLVGLDTPFLGGPIHLGGFFFFNQSIPRITSNLLACRTNGQSYPLCHHGHFLRGCIHRQGLVQLLLFQLFRQSCRHIVSTCSAIDDHVHGLVTNIALVHRSLADLIFFVATLLLPCTFLGNSLC